MNRLADMTDAELAAEISSLKRTASAAPGSTRMLAQQRLDDAKAERDRREHNPSGLTGLICVAISFGAIALAWGSVPHA